MKGQWKAAIFLWFCLTAISSPARDRAPRVVMFWNLENFFNPNDDPKKNDDDFTPKGDYHWTWKRLDTKKAAVAKTISAVRDSEGDYPFLIGICEVEDKVVLRRIVEGTYLNKLDYGFVHYESPDKRGIDVALLYRKSLFTPLKTSALHVSMTGHKSTRDILYVKGISGRDTLHIFTLHWPSKGGGEKESMPGRISAARTLKTVTDSLISHTVSPKIIVMGDFNDTPESKPLLLATSNGLKDLAVPLAGKGKGTIRYRGIWELIDHFLVSKALSGTVMKIFSPDFLLEDENKYLGKKPYRTYYGPRYNGGVSDHLPILLTLPR